MDPLASSAAVIGIIASATAFGVICVAANHANKNGSARVQ